MGYLPCKPHQDGQFSYGLAIGILLFSLLMEGYAFLIAYKEVNSNKGSMTFLMFIRESDDPTSIGVLLEDGIAVIGVFLALLGMALSHYFHTQIPDAIASILIGVLLGFLAVIMAYTNGRLLINRSLALTHEDEIRKFILALETVDKITVLKTEIIAPDQVKLSLEIDFNVSFIEENISDDSVSNIIQKSVKGVGKAINEMEKQIQNRFPNIKYIDLEIN